MDSRLRGNDGARAISYITNAYTTVFVVKLTLSISRP